MEQEDGRQNIFNISGDSVTQPSEATSCLVFHKFFTFPYSIWLHESGRLVGRQRREAINHARRFGIFKSSADAILSSLSRPTPFFIDRLIGNKVKAKVKGFSQFECTATIEFSLSYLLCKEADVTHQSVKLRTPFLFYTIYDVCDTQENERRLDDDMK